MATIDFIIQKAGGGTINLYNKNSATLSTITNAEQSQGLNSDDIVRITVESAVKIAFEIGDKINILGRWYKINRLPSVKKTGNRLFTYTIELEGVQYDLARAAYDLTIDTTNNELQDVQADMLTGNLERFARVLISNANRVFPGKWILGEFPAGAEDKTLAFGETDNCLLVLQRLCTEYNTEFDITQAGDVNTINFRKAGQIFPYTFEYGKGKGLYSLERLNVSTANIVTRLKVYGGSRNITTKYRSARLCLPGKTKGQSFIEKADPVNKYGVWEATKYFDHIYPKRTGIVTAVSESDVLKLTDTTMNFDLNEMEVDGITTKYLIEGVTAKIHFNTGNLSGYEFEIQEYDHATKTFTLKSFEDERGERFPSSKSTAFQFGVNDEYVILDIALPQEYEDSSEAELQAEGDTFYDQNSQPKVQYSLEVSEDFLKELSGEGSITNIFSVGDYIPVKDLDIDVDKSVRIQSFTRDLLNPFSYKLTISDTVTTSITNKVISELIDIDNVTKINDIKNQVKARRDWRAARELQDMIFDVEGNYYTEKIKPGSIETQMLSVGAKSSQFGLVGTVIQANYNGNKNSVNVKGGVLSHYTIAENGRDWNLANNTTTLIGDSTPYYIYAKCQKVGTGGSVIFSTEKITVEQDPLFYHFFVGIVNSVDPELNVRSVALTYGFTTVNGKFIRTGRIQSNDGNTYFDLDTGEIGGKITFRSTAGTDEDLAEILDGVGSDIQDTQGIANAAALKAQQAIDNAAASVTDYNAKFAEIQAQVDGEISNYSYPYTPTLLNYPASDWATDIEKDRHIGDVFHNSQAFVDNETTPDSGKAWRFVKNGTAYSWTPIADSDAVKAIQEASKAQAMADGKSTTYLIQPTKYKLGDMWVLNADQTVNGTAYKSGEILTATQDSATYNQAHWVKRVRYTDDSAVNNLQIGGRNLRTGTYSDWRVMTMPAAYGVTTPLFAILDDWRGKRVTHAFEVKDVPAGEAVRIRIDFHTNELDYVIHTYGNVVYIEGKSYVTYTIPADTQYTMIRMRVSPESFTSPYSFSLRCEKLEFGNKPTDWSPAPEDVQAEIDAAKQEALTAAGNAQSTADDAHTAVDDLDTYVDGAFKDGVIDAAEAKAIEKYINSVNEIMAKAEASFAKVFANTYLEGAAKTALENAKINLWGQRDTLLTTINNAIADGKTTVAEKSAVDSAFNTFNNLMSAFQSALEEANKAIQAKLDSLSTEKVNNLEIGVRNLFILEDYNPVLSGGAYYHYINAEIGKQYTVSTNIPKNINTSFDSWFDNEGVAASSSVNGFAINNPRTITATANRIYIAVRDTTQINGIKNGAYWVKVEKGNKATDWTPAPEDVDKKISDVDTKAIEALAKANISKAITDKFGTTIDGGLINTVTVELRESDTQDVTAGHTGIQGPLKNLPAYWAGGTYADAIAGIAKAIIYHDGRVKFEEAEITGVINALSGRIGHLTIEELGRIVMKDPATAKERLIFANQDIPTVAYLENQTQDGGNTSIGALSVTTGVPNVYSSVLNVTQNGSTLTFGGTTMNLQATAPIGQGVTVQLALTLERNSATFYTLGGVNVFVDSGQTVSDSLVVAPITWSGLPSGSYRIKLERTYLGTLSSLAGTSTASTLSWTFSKDVDWFQFGLNGMMSWWQNLHAYFSNTEISFRAPSDKFDAPGVLAKGRISAAGVRDTTKAWGAKNSTSTITKPSGIGSYRVPVNCPNADYDVNISPRTSNRMFHVGATTATYFEVYFQDRSGASQDSDFSYTLVGNNY